MFIEHVLRRRMRGLAAATLLCAVAAGCATNPVTGRRELALVSEAQEIQMGQQAAQEVSQQLGLLPGTQERLEGLLERRIGQRLEDLHALKLATSMRQPPSCSNGSGSASRRNQSRSLLSDLLHLQLHVCDTCVLKSL